MKLSKPFLLAILAAPAALVGMEDDAQYQKAPKIFQVLMRAAAKELNVPDDRYVSTIFIKETENALAFSVANWLRSCWEPFHIFLTGKGINCPFSIKKATILHEMAHVADRTHIGHKERETFADTQMVIHLKCLECAQEVAGWHQDLDGQLTKMGYLTDKQILELAEKTYRTGAQCPYHRQIEKRRSNWSDIAFWRYMCTKLLARSEWRTFKEVEQEVADGKLEV